MLYWVVAHENRAKSQKLVTLVSIVGSLAVLQMAGVMGSLSFVWPDPFATVVELGSVMNFRFEFLHLDYVVSASTVQRYAGTLFGFRGLDPLHDGFSLHACVAFPPPAARTRRVQ